MLYGFRPFPLVAAIMLLAGARALAMETTPVQLPEVTVTAPGDPGYASSVASTATRSPAPILDTPRREPRQSSAAFRQL